MAARRVLSGNSVDLSQGLQSQPDVTQERRHLPTAEATVEEQLGQTVRVHHPHGRWTTQPMGDAISGGDARGDADRILELVARYPVLLGNDIERLADTEERERILQPRATADEDRLPESALGINDDVSDLVGR
jgi:hypothetical protein